MSRLVYGNINQLVFKNEHEKFKTIGYLTNPSNANITKEFNSLTNSYTDAYRIKLINNFDTVESSFPGLEKARRSQDRINCNDFVTDLTSNYGFTLDGIHINSDFDTVKDHIPKPYQAAFIAGYNL